MTIPKVSPAFGKGISVQIVGGFFQIADTAMSHIMDWHHAHGVLYQWMIPGRELEPLLVKIAEKLKGYWAEYLEMGKHKVMPLSPFTLAAREKNPQSQGSDGFMFDTGALVRSFEIAVEQSAGGAHTLISIKPDRSDASHGKGASITNLAALAYMCQNGLALYAEDLTEEKIIKIMAWRDANFGGSKKKELGEDVKNAVSNDAVFNERGDFIDARKPIVFIPPRPLMTEDLKEGLTDTATREAGKYVELIAKYTARLLGSRWGMDGPEKLRQLVRSLDLGGK